MNKEENIGGREGFRTGHTAEAEGKRGSAVWEKFKDADALAEAYGALEAEFTRRSQRLKELERKAENSRKESGESAGARPDEAEKPEAAAAEAALAPKPDSYTQGREPASPSVISAGEPAGAAETRAATEEEIEEALYRAAGNSERVRLKIIGDYLSSLKSADAPLMRGGTGTLAVPCAKPKSIDEAGTMALRYFKKDNQA